MLAPGSNRAGAGVVYSSMDPPLKKASESDGWFAEIYRANRSRVQSLCKLNPQFVLGHFFILLIWAGTALAEVQPEFLPDGSLRPGTRITIPAGTVREFLFKPEGVRFLSGRARIVSVGRPFIDPEGREMKEFFIDVGKSPGVPWMHDEKLFRLRIRAETDFTLEARRSWEWTPDDERKPL